MFYAKEYQKPMNFTYERNSQRFLMNLQYFVSITHTHMYTRKSLIILFSVTVKKAVIPQPNHIRIHEKRNMPYK